MTEEEAKKAMFDLHFEYMKHTPKERLKLYDEYQEKRGEIRRALISLVMSKREEVGFTKK